MTESVRLQPGMDEAFSPGDPRICSVVLMSTSVECLMENSITSEGINGVSPWASLASKYPEVCKGSVVKARWRCTQTEANNANNNKGFSLSFSFKNVPILFCSPLKS